MGIDLKDVKKIYEDDLVAISDFSLEIQNHEIIVIAGPTDSGKLTLLRLIAGLDSLSAGRICIDGLPVDNTTPSEVALISKNCAFFPHMSVFKNMSFGLKLRNLPKNEIEERVKAATAMLDIENILWRKPTDLDQWQILAIAIGRAMIRQPKVFLFYQPLADIAIDCPQNIIFDRISKILNILPTTVIYATDNPTEALALGTKIVVINQGKIQQIADPKTLLEQPANKFITDFFKK